MPFRKGAVFVRKHEKILAEPFGNDPEEWAKYKIAKAEYDKHITHKRKRRKFLRRLYAFIGWLAAVVAAVTGIISLFK
jgi:hypothetical protein